MNKLTFGFSVLLFSLFFLFGFSVAAQRFKVGDRVEATYAGDWYRGTVVGDYQKTEFGYSTYEIKYDGSTGTTRLNAEYVRAPFRTNAEQTFQPGDRVEFLRWDNKPYEGEIIGKDNDRYEIRYQRDGYTTTEWVREISVRPSAKAPAVAVTAAAGKKAPGQVFAIGDRVLYDDLGFLATKGYGTVISYDDTKRLYTVRDEKDASLKYSYTCYQVLRPNAPINNDFFIGKWEVRIIGATSTFSKDGNQYRRFSGGMQLPPLEIKANGTYTWVLPNKKVINGVWKPRNGVPGITLLKALDGLDYTLYEKTEGFATSKTTRDEIGIHHLPSSTGYYHAYRMGPNKSCVLAGRKF